MEDVDNGENYGCMVFTNSSVVKNLPAKIGDG